MAARGAGDPPLPPRGSLASAPAARPHLQILREARNLSFKGNLQTFKRWPNFQKHRVGRTHHTHQPSAGAHLVGVPTRGLGSFLLFRELVGPLRISGSKKPQWRAKKTDSQLTTPAASWDLGARGLPACFLLPPLPSVHLTLSFLPPSPSLSVICLSLSLSISCSLSVHLQVADFHLHPSVSLLCVGLSHSLRLLTSLSLHVSLHLCLSLPVCVSVSLCLCVYISLSLYLSMSRPISLLRSLKPEIRFPSSACSKVHLTVSQGARAVDNC